MKRRSKDAPTWVKHPKHGWLVDECPLFETPRGGVWMSTGRNIQYSQVGVDGAIDIGACEIARNGNGLNAPFWDGWDRTGRPDCYFQPLTTAARDLVDALREEGALKAEQESK